MYDDVLLQKSYDFNDRKLVSHLKSRNTCEMCYLCRDLAMPDILIVNTKTISIKYRNCRTFLNS